MNTLSGDHVLGNIRHSKVSKILLILIIISIIANGVQGYFIWKQIKDYKGLEEIINNKSNCEECLELPEPTPEATPAPTRTKSGSSGSDSDTEAPQDPVATPETVIEPPRPPAD